jgi:D-alanyl-D-alanine dipeptidase
LQEELFHQYRKTIEFKYPGYTEAQLINETEQYVSFPAVVPSAPYPHLTGGALDLTICDAEDKPLPMGTGFDQFESQSRTRYFEEELESGKELTPEERTYLTNRRLLFHSLTTVGFTNYSEEWWHYDYGNQFWGCIKGRDAIYGPVSYEHDFT